VIARRWMERAVELALRSLEEGTYPVGAVLTDAEGCNRALPTGDPRVRVLQGDWQQALGSGPFDLIFSDCNPAKRETAHLPALVACLTPGGTLLVDNFSPPHLLPPALRAGGDLEREALFDPPELWALELPVSRHEHVILATRKR